MFKVMIESIKSFNVKVFDDSNSLIELLGEGSIVEIIFPTKDLLPLYNAIREELIGRERKEIKVGAVVGMSISPTSFRIGSLVNSAFGNTYWKNNETQRLEAHVHIYLIGKIEVFEGEKITNAAVDFMESLGFLIESTDEPIFSSYWRRLKFVFQRHVSPEELEEVFMKGKKALELKYLDLPTADQTVKLATAAGKLVTALNKFEQGVIRLGAIIVIKKKIDDMPQIFIHQLSHELMMILDKNPKLLHNLQTTYELVTGDVSKQSTIPLVLSRV